MCEPGDRPLADRLTQEFGDRLMYEPGGRLMQR